MLLETGMLEASAGSSRSAGAGSRPTYGVVEADICMMSQPL